MSNEQQGSDAQGAADYDDEPTVTVRVRPQIDMDALKTAVPNPPQATIEKPATATAREAFGEGQPAVPTAANRGAMIGVALVGSIIAGATVGFLVDRLMNTQGTPWGLIVGTVIGALAGFVTVQNLSKSMRS